MREARGRKVVEGAVSSLALSLSFHLGGTLLASTIDCLLPWSGESLWTAGTRRYYASHLSWRESQLVATAAAKNLSPSAAARRPSQHKLEPSRTSKSFPPLLLPLAFPPLLGLLLPLALSHRFPVEALRARASPFRSSPFSQQLYNGRCVSDRPALTVEGRGDRH